MTDDELARMLDHVRADLLWEFRSVLAEEEVRRRFDEIVAQYDGAPVRTFVPVLAQRQARLELRRAVPA